MTGADRVAPHAIPPERTLRRLYLTLFLRGRSARGIKKGDTPTTVGRKLLQALGIYALFGLFALWLLGQPVFVLGIYLHAMTFILVGMFVAMSAGEVLFNKEEADILLHRPIAPPALLWAKIGVLLQVSLWLAGAFNLAGLFVGVAARDGGWLFPAAHAVSTSLEALFCTATVVLTYQLCLRWFGREKLDALMTATQVLVVILFVLGGQLVPQLLIRSEGKALVGVDHWWVALLPPSWFAALDDALAGSHASSSWILALLGIAATAAVLWIAFGKLAPDYEAGLKAIAESTTRRPRRTRRRLLERLVNVPPLNWWLGDSVSRASFLLSAAYLARDRDTKLRIYPGLAPMLVLPIIALLPHARSGGGSSSFGIAFAASYLALLPLLSLGMLQLSQQWQASDIFRLAPMRGPAALCHGARRAVLLLITLPMVMIFAGIVMFTGHRTSQIVLMLPGIIALPAYAMFACLGGAAVPLSHPPVEGKAAGRTASMIGVMFSSAVLAGISSWAHSGAWLGRMLTAEAVIVAGIYFVMRVSVKRARWPSID